jgi:iron complex outermembrane receptor protein
MNKIISLLVFLILIIHAKAQDTTFADSIYQMDEIQLTYTANWSTPVTYQNIYLREIKSKSTGQEPSFILSGTPSVTVYSESGNTQGYSYIRLRGIDQTRINFTLDGVPLNEPEDQGAYFSNYPDILNSVSKIQIQRGVGTTKNGAASYAGSVELSSINLDDSTRKTIGLGYGSFNSYRIFGEYHTGVKKRKALYVRASQIHSDGYKYNSSNNSQSLFLSTGLFYDRLHWKLNILAGHQQNEQAWLGVSDSLIAIDRRTNANKNEKDNFIQCLAQLQNKWFVNQTSFIQSSIYYTFLKGNYDFNLNNFLGLPSTEELYNYALRSNLIGFFSNYSFTGKKLNWTTGVHINTYNRQHIGSEKSVGQLYKNTGYKNEASIFSKATYTIKKLNLFADIQYRYSSFAYEGGIPLDKLQWTFINPKAGISLNVKSHSLLYYIIGRSGREPTRTDLFGGNDDLMADSNGEPILGIKHPEYVIDQELGFKHQATNADLNFNVYYMKFKNEIVLNGDFGPNSLALTNNVEQSIRAGAEVTIGYRISKSFSFINNSSFNYSRIKEQQEIFAPILTPPVIVNQELVYSYRKISIALIGRYQSPSFIDFANTSSIDDYILINSRINYQLQRLQISVFVNNLTNANYFNNGYVDSDGSKKYFVQAPVNFYINLVYSF